MKTIVRKLYWDYEKEERWLNDMAAKGLALSEYSFCKYTFIESDPGEYIYRIELLKALPSNKKSKEYLEFMKENNIELIATYFKWAFFRKKAVDGPFDIYSDITSKIKHYQRVNLLWFSGAILNLGVGLINVIQYYSIVNIFVGSINICLGILLLRLFYPLKKRINILKKEKSIRE